MSQAHENSRRQRNRLIEVHSSPPLDVILIAACYLFGAVVLLFNFFTSQRDQVDRYIASVYNLSPSFGIYPLVFTVAIAILIAIGLFSLSRWGLYLTILYLVYFGGISCFLIIEHASQPYYGNFIWSLIVIVYLLVKRKRFLY